MQIYSILLYMPIRFSPTRQVYKPKLGYHVKNARFRSVKTRQLSRFNRVLDPFLQASLGDNLLNIGG